jgi:hypothetical protein
LIKDNTPGLIVDDFPSFIVGKPVAGIRTVAKSDPTSASSTIPEENLRFQIIMA